MIYIIIKTYIKEWGYVYKIYENIKYIFFQNI